MTFGTILIGVGCVALAGAAIVQLGSWLGKNRKRYAPVDEDDKLGQERPNSLIRRNH